MCKTKWFRGEGVKRWKVKGKRWRDTGKRRKKRAKKWKNQRDNFYSGLIWAMVYITTAKFGHASYNKQVEKLLKSKCCMFYGFVTFSLFFLLLLLFINLSLFHSWMFNYWRCIASYTSPLCDFCDIIHTLWSLPWGSTCGKLFGLFTI